MNKTLRNIPEGLIPDNTILLAYRGSIAHGTYIPSHIDDKDLMGVAFGPVSMYLGLDNFEQLEKMIEPWDSVVYEIKKFFRLLLKQNPNVISLMWCEPHHYVYISPEGQRLLDNRELFISKKAFHSFSGYAHSQFMRMETFDGSGKGYMGEKRKRLAKEFGYDCKNASHLIRLLRMGIEYLTEGKLYVLRKDAQELVDIKLGKWSLEKVKREAEHLFDLAKEAYVRSPLPNEPDIKKVNELLMEMIYYYVAKEAGNEGLIAAAIKTSKNPTESNQVKPEVFFQ